MTGSKRKKIGLALGSGGARGLVHIGVLKTLEENNIPIDFIAGTSIGAMIGGFYAAGLSTEEIERIALSTSWRKVISVLFEPKLKQGLIGGEKTEEFIRGYLDGAEFKDCKIPFVALATDLKTGESVVLDKGEMAPAIRASISIPLVFRPVELGNWALVDGGLSAPVPVNAVRNMGADLVIAINLDKHYFDEEWKSGFYDIANDSLNILRHHLALLNASQADIVIDVNVRGSYWYQFVNGQDKILAGQEVTKNKISKLKELIGE